MGMTFKQYIGVELPKKCGVHPSYGKIAELVFDAENMGDPAFQGDQFESHRQRGVVLFCSYDTDFPEEKEKGLDVIELSIANHRQTIHGEDHNGRMEILKEKINDSELVEMALKGWWWG